jgi:hypothetical protein
MQVKMLTIAAGPEFNYDVGAIVEVTPKQAKELIEGGYAVPVPPEHETTSAKHPHAEHAVSHEHKGK